MKKIILILLIFPFVLFAQTKTVIKIIESYYQSFEYEKVIELSGKALESNEDYTDSEKIKILMMQAISYYSLGNEEGARQCIINILSIDKEFEPDPVTTSPKIINFYHKIKIQFNQILESKNEDFKIEEQSGPQEPLIKLELQSQFNGAVYKSLLLPGLGHLSIGSKTKGWIITPAGTALLTGMVYYIFDTAEKQKIYLNETNPDLISGKYDDYNSSYKLRNGFIIAYAALWLYTQADLLFGEYENFILEKSRTEVTLSTGKKEINFNFRLNF